MTAGPPLTLLLVLQRPARLATSPPAATSPVLRAAGRHPGCKRDGTTSCEHPVSGGASPGSCLATSVARLSLAHLLRLSLPVAEAPPLREPARQGGLPATPIG